MKLSNVHALAEKLHDVFGLYVALSVHAAVRSIEGKAQNQARSRIEIMVRRLEDRRGIATRGDRRPMAFLTAVVLAAAVIFRR